MSDSQTDVQPFFDHPFFPWWRDDTLCAFDHHPLKDGTRLCSIPQGEHRYALQPKIEIEVWKPNPDAKYPGTVILDYRRTVQNVLDELNAKLALEGVDIDEYGFSNMTKYDDPSMRWPAYRWIAVYPVTGGSEGHYIHIETIAKGDAPQDRVATCLGLAKTFRGWDYACRISMRAARLLQA